MIDESLAHERHCLETAMGMLREPGDGAPVVHPPALGALEVHAEIARRERRGRAHVLVRLGVQVEMVHAEEERVDRRPLEPEWYDLQDRIRVAHALRL